MLVSHAIPLRAHLLSHLSMQAIQVNSESAQWKEESTEAVVWFLLGLGGTDL